MQFYMGKRTALMPTTNHSHTHTTHTYTAHTHTSVYFVVIQHFQVSNLHAFYSNKYSWAHIFFILSSIFIKMTNDECFFSFLCFRKCCSIQMLLGIFVLYDIAVKMWQTEESRKILGLFERKRPEIVWTTDEWTRVWFSLLLPLKNPTFWSLY